MKTIYLHILVLFLTFGQVLNAQKTIWQGSRVTITKVDNADFTMAANQDRITDSVWITRKATQSIFNIAVESKADANSPAKTLWAYGATDRIDTLNFNTWNNTHGNNPTSAIGEKMVLFIPADSLYMDFKLLSFTSGGTGGGFSYERSTRFQEKSITLQACRQYTSPSGKLISESIVFMDTLYGNQGNDTIFTIHVTIVKVDAGFTQVGNNFSAKTSGAAYQWLDCGNGYKKNDGATNAVYVATAVGIYALEVTLNECKDTSACYNHGSLSTEILSGQNKVHLYPNPFEKDFQIQLDKVYEEVNIGIFNVLGEQISAFRVAHSSYINITPDLAKGIYLVRITMGGNSPLTYKLIKE